MADCVTFIYVQVHSSHCLGIYYTFFLALYSPYAEKGSLPEPQKIGVIHSCFELEGESDHLQDKDAGTVLYSACRILSIEALCRVRHQEVFIDQ